ncbi:macro domain-containing protein [Adlercreutzia sp. R21]|uniref:Macro domain-containing protein n=1 Tax=Adlercreutzia wanghongyangiae TaxID=3111451 RepID=A0ABU6IHZ2_9ACTN|nr:macro domain-containing protein [Adlercreutzia sp. R21]MEC4176055.1 macro domain-containing protein [Adlercreutzia sp. R7]MEC4183705.1 macro domain-containing protein [Adlercreutzia sp. R21]
MRVLIGDMFESNASALVNTVNCVGVMGKGIASIFKRRFPENYRDYRFRCSHGMVKPGEPYIFSGLIGPAVINFPTKDHWRSPSRLSYVERGLDWFADNWDSLGVDSVAFPPLGCGNGGLRWEDVGPLMYRKLKDIPLDISIYAPYGTPRGQLNTSFLAQACAPYSEVGRYSGRYNRKWDLVLAVIQELDSDSLSLSVGRTAYQKICYILTRSGVATGFVFGKGDYGPFSVQAKDALSAMANCNYITETTLGHMIRLSPSDGFVFDPGRFTAAELEAVRVTVDLFSRIRDTREAEIASTLIFAHDQLKKAGGLISEEQIIDYVIAWKPHWASETVRRELTRALFQLAALGVIGVQQLTYIPEEDF